MVENTQQQHHHCTKYQNLPAILHCFNHDNYTIPYTQNYTLNGGKYSTKTSLYKILEPSSNSSLFNYDNYTIPYTQKYTPNGGKYTTKTSSLYKISEPSNNS